MKPELAGTPGKVAVVTGSSRGIGRAIALRLSEDGATIVLNGVDQDRLDAVTGEFASLGRRALGVRADVTREDGARRLILDTLSAYGRLDILVNNAGGRPVVQNGGKQNSANIEAIPLAEWLAYFDLNLHSAFLCSREAIPHMKKQRSGRIINVSSRSGRNGSLFMNGMPVTSAAYVSAKAAMLGLTKQLCLELAPFGITCNAVAPGTTMTESLHQAWASLTDGQKQARVSGIPMGRIAEAREIASVVSFLASNDSSYVNGVTIDVNGGAYLPG